MAIISKINFARLLTSVLIGLAFVFLVLIVRVVWLMGHYSNVSIDSQPSDIRSARQLARSVARIGKCDGGLNLEDFDFQKDYAVFDCQKGNGSKRSFLIYAFYNQVAKNKVASNLMSKEEWSLFKTGPFYLISAGIPEYKTSATPEDYVDFPGELSR